MLCGSDYNEFVVSMIHSFVRRYLGMRSIMVFLILVPLGTHLSVCPSAAQKKDQNEYGSVGRDQSIIEKIKKLLKQHNDA